MDWSFLNTLAGGGVAIFAAWLTQYLGEKGRRRAEARAWLDQDDQRRVDAHNELFALATDRLAFELAGSLEGIPIVIPDEPPVTSIAMLSFSAVEERFKPVRACVFANQHLLEDAVVNLTVNVDDALRALDQAIALQPEDLVGHKNKAVLAFAQLSLMIRASAEQLRARALQRREERCGEAGIPKHP